MTIYQYELSNQTDILVSPLETKINSSNYSLISNPNRRIPKDSINKINPETRTLYLTERDDTKARSLFAQHLRNQAEVYRHISESLLNQAKALTEKEKI